MEVEPESAVRQPARREGRVLRAERAQHARKPAALAVQLIARDPKLRAVDRESRERTRGVEAPHARGAHRHRAGRRIGQPVECKALDHETLELELAGGKAERAGGGGGRGESGKEDAHRPSLPPIMARMKHLIAFALACLAGAAAAEPAVLDVIVAKNTAVRGGAEAIESVSDFEADIHIVEATFEVDG